MARRFPPRSEDLLRAAIDASNLLQPVPSHARRSFWVALHGTVEAGLQRLFIALFMDWQRNPLHPACECTKSISGFCSLNFTRCRVMQGHSGFESL